MSKIHPASATANEHHIITINPLIISCLCPCVKVLLLVSRLQFSLALYTMADGVLSGILKWSLSQGSGLAPDETVQPMTEADREFLENAFEHMVIDEIYRMKVIAQVLRLPEDQQHLETLAQQSTEWINKMKEVTTGVTEGESVRNIPTLKEKKKKKKNQGEADETEDDSAPAVDISTIDFSSLLSDLISRKEGALDELDERVLSVDNAADLYTVGGFPPLLQCLSSSYPSIQWRACQALATICQNHPKCQQFAYDFDAIPILLHIIHAPSSTASTTATSTATPSSADHWQVMNKALYALSAILRSTTPAAHDFIRAEGIEALCKILAEGQVNTRTLAKCLTLVRYLLQSSDPTAQTDHQQEYPHSNSDDHQHVKEILKQMNIVPILLKYISAGDISVREECARLLSLMQQQQLIPTSAQAELSARVKQRLVVLAALTGEDGEAADEESRLLSSLST